MDLVATGVDLANGLPLFCDVTMASPFTAAGEPRNQASRLTGSSLAHRIAAKNRTYSDLSDSASAKLLVLGTEVYGHCSEDVGRLLAALAGRCSRREALWSQASARQRWLQRFWGLLSCACARATADCSLRSSQDVFSFQLGGSPPLAEDL